LRAELEARGFRSLEPERPGALALGTIGVRRKDLAVDVRADVTVGAGHGRDASAELRIEVVVPQGARLHDVQIAVHDAEPVLGHVRALRKPEERHGFAGAFRALGVWGPFRGPQVS